MWSSAAAVCVCCAAWLVYVRGSALSAGAAEEAALRDCGGAEFALETGALVAEAGARSGEAGWLLRGNLRLAVLWPPPQAPHSTGSDDLLLRFELSAVHVLGRGAGARAEWRRRPSLWDASRHASSEFHAHWRRGAVLRAYLDRDDHPDVANYKRSLISLFQFQMLDGERNETDISGNCIASYESLSPDHLRKTKERCAWGGVPAPEWVVSRRVTRYTLGAGSRLAAVRAHETHEAGTHGVKARAWSLLERREPEHPASAPAPLAAADMAAALATLPDRFQPTSLEMSVPDDPLADEESQRADIAEALREWEAAEGSGASERAGGGGDARLARALLRLLPHVARPTARDQLLATDKDLEAVVAAARVAGLAGGPLPPRLALRDAPAALAAAYLHAFAVSPHPDETVTQQLLSLGDSIGSATPLGRAALLAGAAAARRTPHAAAARDRITAALANCKDDECRELRVQALGNLRREETAALLLEHAETGARRVALAALEALRALPANALTPPRREHLLQVALPAGRALEVRALALDLAAARAQELPAQLARVAATLRDARGAGAELRRVLQGRVATLAADSDSGVTAEATLGDALRPTSWTAAMAGDSSVLARSTGWGGDGWLATLDSLQLAARGVLRRGSVRLALLPPGATTPQPEHDVLSVTLAVRGLADLAGAAQDDSDDDDDDVSGEIGIELMGARLPSITLFSSQAELVGHIWAGSGSAPLPVVRAGRAGGERAARLPLLAGAPLALRASLAAHLALDAQMAVSLWSRTARGGLALRAGVAGRAAATLRAAWAVASVAADAASEPRLNIDIDLDFYTRTALCVRVATDDHDYRLNVTLESVVGDREWRVRRRREHVRPGAGRTLALTRDTHTACRLLQPAH